MAVTISLAQIDVATSEPQKNLDKAAAYIQEAARRGSDLIVFPEMWTTGFQWEWNRRNAAEHEAMVENVAALAKRYSIWVDGSMLSLNDQGMVANTSFLFTPQGEKLATYRKTHLFSFVEEDLNMAPGEQLTLAETPWAKIGMSICYDVRFPELFRTYALKGANLIVLPAGFPHPRLDHWRTLLKARAIENQMYVVAVNQVGDEVFGGRFGTLSYFGHSCVIDPWGRFVVEAGEQEALLTVTIDLGQVEEVRNLMKIFRDRRTDLYDL